MFLSDEPKGKRILVVDDDAAIRELLVIRLSVAGYDVHEARDGRHALTRLPELRPAALILDINMPDMDGFQVLSAMRGQPYTANLRIMVLTARNHEPDVQRAVALGAHDYLAKPFEHLPFLMRTARLLRGAKTGSRPAARQASASAR